MPIPYLRSLTDRNRTPQADRRLARYLIFIAGAANAGGFIAVGRYTSHMTGTVSAMADDLVLGAATSVVAIGLVAVAAFVSGAASTALLVNFGRRRELRSQYALPLFLEGLLLTAFAFNSGHAFDQASTLLWTALLSYVMGLQNAMVTKISKAVVRTTHITGMVTDIGIELGKLVYINERSSRHTPVRADRDKLQLLGSLVALFFVGGIGGAFAFERYGYASALVLAVMLFMLAIVPMADDLFSMRSGT
ncbi:MAG TPA: YoaK family protein [Luteibacter sp.]|jgi:uncharacterized membrane protein YoaK (UPF0700 family)|nr:YoaK family protein [Luteibacter sp.]